MKTLLTIALFVPLMALAQTDTTKTYPGMPMLNVGVNSEEGAFVDVVTPDTTKEKNSFTIDTRYKRITITTVPKPWASEMDSVAEVLKDLRTQRRNQFTYWSGVDVGFNMLLGPDGSTDLPQESEYMELDQINSRFVAINFMEQKIEFGSHHVGLLTGLGWEFTSYRLSHNDLLQFDRDSVYAIPVESPDYRKNKLRQIGIRVPLMFEFNTKAARMPTAEEVMATARDTVGGRKQDRSEFSNKKNFHVAIGVVGSWYYESMYKQKYTENGSTQKDISKGEHYLLPYRAAAAVRIGYGSLNLFAEYGLTDLFERNKGPALTPFNVGLTIIGFN
ncbi:MAG TPA: hypothetical protein PLB89_07735 [Flavobacteriales bacterium]|nr:hypothetical protein [Flavobacteriales bacterium]